MYTTLDTVLQTHNYLEKQQWREEKLATYSKFVDNSQVDKNLIGLSKRVKVVCWIEWWTGIWEIQVHGGSTVKTTVAD